MKSLRYSTIATVVALLIATNLHADDLVLELTTKLGVEKTVTVAKVDTGEQGDATANRLRSSLPTQLFKSDKQYLALSPTPVPKLKNAITHPAMLVAIPWPVIKEIGSKNGISTVTCVDGSQFTGTILTEVTNAGGEKYHLRDCTNVAVKKVAKAEKKDSPRASAKCSVRFDNLDQSFVARRISYRTNFETSEKFQMKVGGEMTRGNLSDFAKVIVKGSGSQPIQITVQAPKGKQTEGELVTVGNTGFVFECANGCAMVLSLRDAFDSKKATVGVTIEATKGAERLPAELFEGFVEKK
jgi:hypothetical protein